MANPLHRMVSSSQVNTWFGQGTGNLSNPSRTTSTLLIDNVVTATTGSPTTGTYSSGGINYKFYKFTATGSITFSAAGLVDVLVVGAGGGSGVVNYGGGAGGFIYQTDFAVTAAAHTVTVGANTTGSGRAGDSAFRSLTAVAGGGGRSSGVNGPFGGSGGGSTTSTTGQSVLNQGNVGATGATTAGGGGAGGVGGATAGGVGTANSITGVSVTYAAGGSTGGGSGTANTGNGAGGSAITNTSGSGVVIILVRA